MSKQRLWFWWIEIMLAGAKLCMVLGFTQAGLKLARYCVRQLVKLTLFKLKDDGYIA